MNCMVDRGKEEKIRNNIIMKLIFNKLWKLLIDRKMNKQILGKITHISSATIAKLGRGENVNTNVLLRICEALNCDIKDIVEIEKK